MSSLMDFSREEEDNSEKELYKGNKNDKKSGGRNSSRKRHGTDNSNKNVVDMTNEEEENDVNNDESSKLLFDYTTSEEESDNYSNNKNNGKKEEEKKGSPLSAKSSISSFFGTPKTVKISSTKDDDDDDDFDGDNFSNNSNNRSGRKKSYYSTPDKKSNSTKNNISNKKSNDHNHTPAGLDELDRLMELAEYESRFDCNRGVGVYEMMTSSRQKSMNPIKNKKTDPKMFLTPWDACQVGVLTRTNLSQSDLEVLDVDDLEIENDYVNPSEEVPRSDARGVVLCTTGTACPSVIAWTDQRVLEDDKRIKKKQDEMARAEKKRANKTKKRNRSNATTSTSSAKEPIDLTGGGGGGGNDSATNTTDTNSRDNTSDDNNETNEVEIVDPSTTSVDPLQPKFLIGTRPTNRHYRCPCDSNPLCLLSCGGVLNEILERRCEEVFNRQDADSSSDHPSQQQGSSRSGGDGIESPPSKRSKSDLTATIKDDTTKTDSDSKMDPSDNTDTNAVPVRDSESDGKKAENERIQSAIKEGDNVFEFRGKDDADDKEEKKVKTRMHNNLDQISKCNQRSVNGSAKKDEETATVRTKEPFIPHHYDDELIKTGPAEIFANKDKSDVIIGHAPYSEDTKRDLNAVRSTTDVDTVKIASHSEKIIRCMSSNEGEGQDPIGNQRHKTVQGYLDNIAEWNTSLIFVNPAEEKNQVQNTKMRLALPPGIENLGATCYLNTQLQCLAQNPVFMNGIFAWRPVNDGHSMNSVMKELQRLLARMLFGKDRKLTTIEFSSALGLEHDEQQDPNEFARLLFDRMGESFQQCDDGTAEGKNLATLLQRIFHGTTTYETRCLACNNISSRQEGFMDINLPILKPTEAGSDDEKEKEQDDGNCKPAKRQKISGCEIPYGNDVDTDLQFCLNQYTSIEEFNGDNQYFCSKCNCKQDAERAPKLTKLPPVLNVQLSRYVFDREKFVKKKVMDKVLLPSVLSIEQHSGAVSTIKKYMLCAVMRHHGTSAYSGHYIAEAMDWTTGLWYEFNDETVRPLPSGPSCSFNIDDHGMDGPENDVKHLSGSQHAYNMYYVDEDYLAKEAFSALDSRLTTNAPADKIGSKRNVENGALMEVIGERGDFYDRLDHRCASDLLVAERLGCRRFGIQKFMFPSLSSLVFPHHSEEDGYVWVDGMTLRDFLSCDTRFDNHLKNKSPILCSPNSLCSHGKIHPRDIRRGKLLRKSQYDAYVALLEAERNELMSVDPSVDDGPIVEELMKTTANGLICAECNEMYCSELQQKMRLVESIKKLYNETLGMNQVDEAPLYYDEDYPPQSDEEKYAYAVAKTSLTKFKDRAKEVFKSVTNFDLGGTPEGKSSTIVIDGIDDLDLSLFPAGRSLCGVENVAALSSDDSFEDFAKVNKKLTCSHDQNKDIQNRQATRYMSHQVWSILKKIFPDAIERKIKRVAGKPGRQKRDLNDQICNLCRFEKEASSTLRSKLDEWSKDVKKKVPYLTNPSRIRADTLTTSNLEVVEPGSRLVHISDISNFRLAVRAFSKRSNFTALKDLISYAEGKAFPNPHAVVLGFEEDKTEKLYHSLRQLSCRKHRLIVNGTIIERVDDNQKFILSDIIVVLSNDEYHTYISSLVGLLGFLDRADRLEIDEPITAPKHLLDDIKRKIDSDRYHPVVGAQLQQGKMSDGNILLFSDDRGNHKEFSISSNLCDCDECRMEIAPILERKRPENSLKFENVSMDGDSEDPPKRSGSVAANPICVDLYSNGDNGNSNSRSVKVFEIGKDATFDEALKSVREAMGLPSRAGLTQETLDKWYQPRRSSRKRKANFPVGCIVEEDAFDAATHHNVAAMKLQLYQTCQVPLSSARLYIVLVVDDQYPIGLEIQFDWASKTLGELIEQLKELLGNTMGLEVDIKENVLFLYQTLPGSDIDDTSMMDALLEVSNLGEKSSDKKKKKERRPERGFSGTLLQSSSAPKNDHKKEDKQSPSLSPNTQKGEKQESPVSAKKSAEDSNPEVRNDARRSLPKQVEVSDDDDDDDDDGFDCKQKHDNHRSGDDGVCSSSKKSAPQGSGLDVSKQHNIEPPVVRIDECDTDDATDGDDDDNDFLTAGPTFSNSSPRGRQSDSIRIRVYKGLDEALTTYGFDAIEDEIWVAVNLAMEANPDSKDVSELVQTAHAIFNSQKE
mmetsp:Transcript_27557/g.66233  ORF Transcript_27557/g.66233 Transcript_27557/m.66233 type:complete len:2159 (-) Transcript_27557:44-6520(-)